ncbi:MAG: hypothetical protein DBX55_01405 [Verrucomicrobia bacterium]|nr:MAG: hypothetical protein DBX55_01405 [Verrucomicrobiota bacterium]
METFAKASCAPRKKARNNKPAVPKFVPFIHSAKAARNGEVPKVRSNFYKTRLYDKACAEVCAREN